MTVQRPTGLEHGLYRAASGLAGQRLPAIDPKRWIDPGTQGRALLDLGWLREEAGGLLAPGPAWVAHEERCKAWGVDP